MRLPLKIAIRFLLSNKGQTVLIALGIAIGVSVQVFIGSLIFGLQESLVDSTIGNSSQITLFDEEGYFDNYKNIINLLKDKYGQIETISSSLDIPAFLTYNNKDDSILLRGIDDEGFDNIYEFENKIILGSTPKNDNKVIVGSDIYYNFNMQLGDEISVGTPEGDIMKFSVVGVFDFKVKTINEKWVIGNLENIQKTFSLDGKVSSIEMQLIKRELFNTSDIAIEMKNDIDSNLSISNWMDLNQQLLSGLNGQSVSSLMIQVFVIISVVLGISSVLAISVIQRSRQIGILKAMGIKNSQASKIFLNQGVILGLIGAILGVSFGLLLMLMFTTFAVNPDGTPVVELLIDYKFILLSAFIALLASTIAALIPARKSSKLNPMEVIRNG